MPPGGCTTIVWHTASPSGYSGFCTTSGPAWCRCASTVLPWRSSYRSASSARQLRRSTGSATPMERSYSEQALHAFCVHVLAAPASDDLTPFHDEILVRERPREIVVLLDQQDRH